MTEERDPKDEVLKLPTVNDASTLEELTKKDNPPENIFNPHTDLKIGYLVGVNQKDEHVWEVFGTETTLTNLVGVHDFAEFKVDESKSTQLMTEKRILFQVAEALTLLNRQVEMLNKQLAKSSNKLQ